MNYFHKNLLLALPVAALTSTCAWALDFNIGDNQSFQLNNALSVGAAVRTESRNPNLVGLANGGAAYSTNGDDGNLHYAPGDLVASAVKLTSDLSITAGDFGLFVRGTGVYNHAIDGTDNLFDDADYGAGKEFPVSEARAKTEASQKAAGHKVELLDAYTFGTLPLGEHSLAVRLGRQSLNWGESTFVLNGINSMVALDANKARVPGFDIAEVLRPAGTVWGSMDLFEGLSMEAFYQYEWRPTIIDASGTYWSTNDFAGPGGTQANIGFGRIGENTPAGVTTLPGALNKACLNAVPSSIATDCVPLGSTIPRAPDRTPVNRNQFGGALRFPLAFLNDMAVGLYAMNYHSRLPVLSGTSRSSASIVANQTDSASYFAEYPENIHLYGMSFNTSVGDWAVQGEYSYKQGQPLQLDDVELLLAGLGAPSQINPVAGATLGGQYLKGYRRKDVQLTDIGLTRILPPAGFFGWDQVIVLAEVAYMHVNGMEAPEKLAYDAPATYTLNAGSAALNPTTAANLPVTPYSDYATPDSWGYNLLMRWSYNNALGPVSLEPTLRFVHDVHGTSPTPISNFVEGRKQMNFVMGFKYLDSWQADVGYVMYTGAGRRNLLGDRDYAEASVRYQF